MQDFKTIKLMFCLDSTRQTKKIDNAVVGASNHNGRHYESTRYCIVSADRKKFIVTWQFALVDLVVVLTIFVNPDFSLHMNGVT